MAVAQKRHETILQVRHALVVTMAALLWAGDFIKFI
jgi:hypothetical protein